MDRSLKLAAFIVVSLMLITPLLSSADSFPVTRASYPKMAQVTVRLTYPNATVAKGCNVYVHKFDSGYGYTHSSGVTDVTGMVEIDVTPYELGPCYITAQNETGLRFVREQIYIEPGGVYERNMVLWEGMPFDYNIHGTVRNLKTGGTISGASVQIYGSDEMTRNININRKTGSDGRYSLYVPYSPYPYSIQVGMSGIPGMRSYSSTLYLNRSITSYQMDVDLRSDPPTNPLNIRFLDSSTGQPIEFPNIVVSGTKAYDDHIPYYYDSYFGLGSPWWLNLSLGKGEYVYSFHKSVYRGGGSMTFSTNYGVIMEDIPITREVSVPIVHDLRNVTFRVVTKGTGVPIPSVNIFSNEVHYEDLGILMRTISSGYTNATGHVTMPMLPGREYEFRFSRYSYDETSITIPAGPVTDHRNIEVEMEHRPKPSPGSGNISILAKDQATGRILPYVTLTGRSDDMYFVGNTMEDGYMNMSVPAVRYYEIELKCGLGTGTVNDVLVQKDGTTTLTMFLTERRTFYEKPRYEYSFRLVNEAGDPLPNKYVPITKEVDGGGGWWLLSSHSDGDGSVRIIWEEGDYEIFKTEVYGRYDIMTQTRTHHVPAVGDGFTVGAPGGMGPDITLYSAHPFTDVSGTVKELGSGDPIFNAGIEYSTGRGLDEDPGLDVVYMKSRFSSTTEGRYRMWGKDEIEYRCTRPGYFPKSGMVDTSSRGPTMDIFLEPLLEMITFVNGTLVDYMNVTSSGYVEIYDLDRDLYEVGVYMPSEDGLFSIPVYPGRFEIRYGNDTIHEIVEITVGEDGLEDLLLVMTPETVIEGMVVNWSEDPLEGIDVDLISGDDVVDTATTDGEGHYIFEALPGTYHLIVAGSELYEEYMSEDIVATGYNAFTIDITLMNRTTGDLQGMVIGDSPIGQGPIIGALVDLMIGSNDTVSSTTTDEDGLFSFADVEYASGYHLHVEPPANMTYDEEERIPGYLPTIHGPFDLMTMDLLIEVELEYREIEYPGYYNITTYSPSGSDVFLNEPIWMRFSHAINISTFNDNVIVHPELAEPVVVWSEGNTKLMIDHFGFTPNTTYTVRVLPGLLSVEGYSLFTRPYFVWNFTTGMEEITWRLDNKVISIFDNRTVQVSVTGLEGLIVYFVIEGIDSFPLTEEPLGTYRGFVQGSLLEWDTEYDYHFSDADGGPDRAPALAGSFMTPEEVIPWKLDSASVKIDKDGNWVVKAEGNPGQDVHIVIDGVGSFKLTETSPGIYETEIQAREFDEGEEYDYWFSDAVDGEDKAPALSGSLKAKAEDPAGGMWWLCCLAGLVSVILLMLVVIIVLVLKKGKGSDIEE
ncbi:MAG: Ig-like domain-containing protein [Candidatus Thermoplasmatota archaeon]|nr:Ig-like domain-containing protein [Candidatus Thermoplasmatota archaeon]